MNEGAAGASSPNAAGLQPRLLALSCSADAVSVALVGLPDSPRPVIECWHEPVKAGRSDALLAMVDGLLRAGGVSARSVSHLVVDVGPGPFTALRVACSVAQGIGLACGASFVSVSSTEALALQSVQGTRGRRVHCHGVDRCADGLPAPGVPSRNHVRCTEPGMLAS